MRIKDMIDDIITKLSKIEKDIDEIKGNVENMNGKLKFMEEKIRDDNIEEMKEKGVLT